MSENFTSVPEIKNSPYAILQGCVSGCVTIFGSFTNAIVMLTYIKWRQSMFETPRDVLIFTLAWADFVTSLFVAPIGLASAISGKWTSGRAGCVWYGFVTTWMGLATILQLTGIAAERYFTLAHPNLRWSYFCKKYTRSFIAIAWLWSGIASSCPLFGWSRYELEGLGLHCSIVWSASSLNYASYSLFLLAFFFVIPLALIIYFYTNVYLMVRKMSGEAESLWGVANMATRQSYVAQVKVARQLFLLTGMFLFAWTPYALMSLLSVTKIIKPSKEVTTLPALFAKLSNIYNPLVYFFTFKRLRRRSFELLRNSGIKTIGLLGKG